MQNIAIKLNISTLIGSMPKSMTKINKGVQRKRRMIPSEDGWANGKRTIFRETDGNTYFEK